MRNKVIAFIAAIGISFAVATPANAQFWGWGGYYPGFGYGFGLNPKCCPKQEADRS